MGQKRNGLSPVSIIIPTLNEADYIGYLLFSLTRQTYRDFEVIVSDGSSEDKTREIVAGFENQLPALNLVVSSQRSPAHQRNHGAQNALYDQLLFLDADTILPPDFLAKSLREIKQKKLDLAYPITFPMTKRVVDQYYYLVINWGLDLLQHVYPLAGGWTLFSTKKIHHQISGFDERLTKMADDTDYVTRSVKSGASFGVVKGCSPFISVRRLDYEGRGESIKSILVQGLYFSLFGKYKTQELINRPFGDYRRLLKNIDKHRPSSTYLRQMTKKQLVKFVNNFKKIIKEI